jgi:hypothetical protein
VTWHKLTSKWVAQIQLNGKNNHIGLFSTALEAAHAYDQKAFELFGLFAYLNFPAKLRVGESNLIAAHSRDLAPLSESLGLQPSPGQT